jgi:peroxiredoxin
MLFTKYLFRSLLFPILTISSLHAAASPTVGERAPEFQLTTVDGRTLRLSETTSNGPVVLLVLRGYPGYQCPFCTRQIQQFIREAPKFTAAGAQVVMVYPGPPQDLQKRAVEFLSERPLPAGFHLVLDPDYQFTNRYGLRWDAPRETAYPSTFLIDRHGIVFFTKIVKAHGGRTSPQEILDVLPNPPSPR